MLLMKQMTRETEWLQCLCITASFSDKHPTSPKKQHNYNNNYKNFIWKVKVEIININRGLNIKYQ